MLKSELLFHHDRVGDVLEKINGVDLLNADHSKAVHAVKESKGLLDIVRLFINKVTKPRMIIIYHVHV